jgi:hypothetical protein
MMWMYSNEWAAGFFDGEGNLYLRKREKRRSREVRTQVTQKALEPLIELQRVWGGSINKTKNPSNCYRWRLVGQGAEAFLKAIAPHSIVKSTAIAEALHERALTRPWRRRS